MELAEPDGLIHHQFQVATGLTLHAVERPGEGEPIFLLHGIWGTWRSWLPLLQAPAEGSLARPLIAMDLRGHGFSDKPQSGYTLRDYAADVVALFDSLGIEKATVIGHSLGSLVSLEIAATNTGRIQTLI